VIGCALLAFAYFARFPGLYGGYVRCKVIALGLILTAGLIWACIEAVASDDWRNIPISFKIPRGAASRRVAGAHG
jgi:hypothetical protein